MKDETMAEVTRALNQLTTDDGVSIHLETLTKIGNAAAKAKAPATKSVADRVVDSLKVPRVDRLPVARTVGWLTVGVVQAGSAQTETHFKTDEVPSLLTEQASG